MAFSPDQTTAVRRIDRELGPFFLTGPAGSGKSFIINHFRGRRGTVVTATTGMAAQLIKGRTLHSFCSIHPQFGVVASGKANQRVKFCDMLIVDEISMASSELIGQIFERFQAAGHEPKLLVVGDFLQLPPVDGEHAFKSPLWGNFTKLCLTTNHRQADSVFLNTLNDIRLGNVTDNVLALVKERKVDSLPTDCTQLFAYRRQAEEMNTARLAQIEGKAVCSKWEVKWASKRGKSTPEEIARGRSRFQEELVLKVGARIVMLTNNVPDDHSPPVWVNGSTGFVVGISSDSVRVELDSGNEVTVRNEEEEILNADGQPEVVVSQFPMSLAFALTIHRAQGSTLDRVGVNLSGHFECGQTYVALSRCKTKEGLYLSGDLSRIMVNQDALAMCGNMESSPEKNELEAALGGWSDLEGDGKRQKCRNCGSVETRTINGPFSGVKHQSKEVCAKCETFVKWIKGKQKNRNKKVV